MIPSRDFSTMIKQHEIHTRASNTLIFLRCFNCNFPMTRLGNAWVCKNCGARDISHEKEE